MTPFRPDYRLLPLEYSVIAVTPGIERALDRMDGAHYLNAPSHGREMLSQLRGELDSLWVSRSDDPLLFAYQIRDALPRIAGLLLAAEKWSHAVIECNDPDLPHIGAH